MNKLTPKIIKFLQSPYELQESAKGQIIFALSAGFFVFTFLFIFKPFGLQNWLDNNPLLLAGYGFITCLVMLVNDFIIKKGFDDDKWAVWKEILWVTWHIVFIGTGNLLYSHFLGITELSLYNYFYFIGITFAVGIFPSAGITLYKYFQKLKNYQQKAADISVANDFARHVQTSLLVLKGENQDEKLSIPSNLLLFIRASENYVDIFYLDPQLASRIFRSSLARIARQIDEPHIMRCHRSYIVNLNNVRKVKGNAQGYQLILIEGETGVPVSRKYAPMVLENLDRLNTS